MITPDKTFRLIEQVLLLISLYHLDFQILRTIEQMNECISLEEQNQLTYLTLILLFLL